MGSILLSRMAEEHWPQVNRIYQEGIDTGLATFETVAPPMDAWDKKFHKKCRMVALENNKVLGWAALQAVSPRSAYDGVAEETVYVSEKSRGKGIGYNLLEALINESEKAGFWMLTASIFSENKTSIHLHEKLGFKIIGTRERIAKRDGKWVNTILMDRRSDKTGL